MAIKVSQFTELGAVDGTIIVPVVDPSPSNTSFRTTVADIQTFILTGTAATADKLYQPVNINGVPFDGSENITVTADASTLTGTTLNSTVVSSSLTSVGTLTNLTVTNTITGSVSGNAGTVTNGVYTTDTGTVTNTMLAGSIANNKLTNNSVTFNGVTVALGGSGSITADIPAATAILLGGVKIGTSINVTVDGTISLAPATTSVLGGVIVGADSGFSIDVSGNLGFSKKFHGFSVNASGDLIYSTTTDATITLQDQYGADIYEDVDIGTSDYSYSLDEDGNLIVTFA